MTIPYREFAAVNRLISAFKVMFVWLLYKKKTILYIQSHFQFYHEIIWFDIIHNLFVDLPKAEKRADRELQKNIKKIKKK